MPDLAAEKGFAAWTMEMIRRGVKEFYDADKAKLSQLFFNGDHWQNGEGWIGPAPMQGEDGYQETMNEIAKAFTSRNVIAEIIERHVRGVVGREPTWGLAPRRAMENDEEATEQEQAAIDEAEALLTEWWDQRGIHEWLKKSVATLLWAKRATLRLYVPRGLLTRRAANAEGTAAVTVIEAVDVKDALSKLYLDHPAPEQATVYEDDATKQKAGIIFYELKNPKRVIGEVVYVDEQGKTVLRQLNEGTEAPASAPTFDFGGRIPMYEMARGAFITDQILQAQRALNLALSMVPRNVVTGGFLERVLLNAQMPGSWEEDEAGERKRFKPLPYKTGAGTTNFVRGLDWKDENGVLHVTDPNIQWREPVPVTAPIEAKRSHYQDILEEADQAHILLTSEATPSGRSREQARADYVASLLDTQTLVEQLGRWLIETALAEAEAFSGNAGRFTTNFRATFNCHLDLGPADTTERAADEASVDKGLLSRETAMVRNGVVDVDAELALINSTPEAKLALLKTQLEVINLAITAQLDVAAAIELVELDDEQKAIIKKALGVNDEPDDDDDDELPPEDEPPIPEDRDQQ